MSGRFGAGRFGTSRFNAGRFSDLGGIVSTIVTSTAPTVTGTPEVGQTLNRTVGSYSGAGPVVVSNGRWTRNGMDIFPAQTGATYLLAPADDGAFVTWAEDVTDGTSNRTVRALGLPVTYAAPTATGTIPDQDMTHTAAEATIVADVPALFSGAALTYTVNGYAGARLDAGALKIDPATEATGQTVTLTATNSGGTAQITFALTVEALAFLTATLTGTGKIGATHTAAATVSRGAAVFGYDFERDGISIGAPDQATYVPVAADNQTALGVLISATVDGVTISIRTATIAITAAPSDVWNITDNGDGTFDIISAPSDPAALVITDNGDGTFNVEAA